MKAKKSSRSSSSSKMATTSGLGQPYVWIGVSALLAIFSVGLSGILKLLVCLLAVLAGGLTVLTAVTLSRRAETGQEQRHEWTGPAPRHCKQDVAMPKDNKLTDNPSIDHELNEIVSYVFRDYIQLWHVQLSHSNTFSHEVHDCLREVIKALADKMQKAQWIPFLTTRLVDDVASHVRLYKQARLNLRGLRSGRSDQFPEPTSGNGKLADLETMFFDAEVAMEGESICRDMPCTIAQEEINYLQDVADFLLFLLLPKTDFEGHPLRFLTRELLVHVILKPTLDLVSDPDWINQSLVWFYKDYPVKAEIFSLTVRRSENIDELFATREIVSKEISFLRSNDSKSEMDSSLKQQLNALLYLIKNIDARLHRLQNGSDTDSIGVPAQVDWNQPIGPGLKLFDMPTDVILKNNLALGYFIDYMQSIGCQAYIFFYLNIEGWKVSAEQQLQAIEEENTQHQLAKDPVPTDWVKIESHRESLLENMREAAHSIYEVYLSEKANPRVKVDDSVVKRLLFKIRTEPPHWDWFAEVQDAVFRKLTSDERFLDAFKRSMGYVKLLAELDLLSKSSEDDVDTQSSIDDELSIYDSVSLNSYDDELHREYGTKLDNNSKGSGLNMVIPEREGSTGPAQEEAVDPDATLTPEDSGYSGSTSSRSHRRMGSDSLFRPSGPKYGHSRNASQGSLGGGFDLKPVLAAEVQDFQIVKEPKGGNPYATYVILVRSRNARGIDNDSRTIYRRYSDFYALRDKVSKRFPDLAKLEFPSKKTFGNMNQQVLTKRRHMLDQYLQELLKTDTLEQHSELLDYLNKFLDQASYEAERAQASNMAKAVGTVKNSVKSVSYAVTSVTAMPGAIFNTAVDGISKVSNFGHRPLEPVMGKVGAVLDQQDSANDIPLRIILLFMDEVFDLRERNQWLRRQIVAVLRQILKAMFGDIMNRRIVDYFGMLTSPEVLGSYLKSLKDALWPNGFPAAQAPPRDESTKMRTRMAAKMALFSSLPEELKTIIGRETSRSGLLMLFDMLQHSQLNKRLALVMLEGILETVFQDKDFPSLFKKLYSNSSRIRNEFRNSQRKRADLRR